MIASSSIRDHWCKRFFEGPESGKLAVKSKIMKFYLATLLLLSGFYACSQHPSNKQQVSDKKVGGSCEGCEAIFESPLAFQNLSSIDTLPDFNEPGPKLEISGIIYKSDGKTPAPN